MSLIVSTFIYGCTPGSLSFADGLLVTLLPVVLTVGALSNPFVIVQGKMKLKIALILHVVFCALFGLALWSHIDTYGTTPGCNVNSSVKFVLFGKLVGVTSKGLRVFVLVSFLISIVFLPLMALLLLFSEPGMGFRTNGPKVIWWLPTALQCGVWVYEVVTIEQIIHRNGLSRDTSQWTYGQTFSLVLLLGPAFNFVSAVWRRCGTQENVPTQGMHRP